MQFFRVVSFLVAFFALGMLSNAAPTAEVKRQDSADVTSIITDLNTQVSSLLSEISALGESASLTTVSPLVYEIETLFDTAATTLSLLSLRKRELFAELDERQLGDIISTVAGLLGGLVNTVTEVLGGLTDIPGLSGVTSILGLPIGNVLTLVEGILPGVLSLVAGLLVTVVGLLSDLGLGNLLGILSL